ncbi:MAG: hypothetical protein HYR96_10035 [Deltaproteobacteria bacterium]|nr:hypothetical protein [Deltaproteobacteria bacterium]
MEKSLWILLVLLLVSASGWAKCAFPGSWPEFVETWDTYDADSYTKPSDLKEDISKLAEL